MLTVRDHLIVFVVGASVLAGCSKKAEPEAAPAITASAATAATFEPPPTPAPSASAPAEAAPVAAAPKPDATQIKACCAALHAAEAKAGPKEKSALQTTTTVCDGIAKLVASGKTKHSDALTSLRAAARGVALPSACK